LDSLLVALLPAGLVAPALRLPQITRGVSVGEAVVFSAVAAAAASVAVVGQESSTPLVASPALAVAVAARSTAD
jgi:hypothetical protein